MYAKLGRHEGTIIAYSLANPMGARPDVPLSSRVPQGGRDG